jgi:hypothetical protein
VARPSTGPASSRRTWRRAERPATLALALPRRSRRRRPHPLQQAELRNDEISLNPLAAAWVPPPQPPAAAPAALSRSCAGVGPTRGSWALAHSTGGGATAALAGEGVNLPPRCRAPPVDTLEPEGWSHNGSGEKWQLARRSLTPSPPPRRPHPQDSLSVESGERPHPHIPKTLCLLRVVRDHIPTSPRLSGPSTGRQRSSDSIQRRRCAARQGWIGLH